MINNVQNVNNSCGSTNTEYPYDSGDSSNPFGALTNQVWEAIQQYQADGADDITVQNVMQDVNNLMAFFKAQGAPTQINNPNAYKIYQLLTLAGSGTSLANLCATLGTATGQSNVQYFEGEFQVGNDQFSALETMTHG